MSVREEDRRKNNCPSRGLGLAAEAIGVGVGAALYYFFNKRSENPDSEGSTSGNWSCEEAQALTIIPSSSGCTTILEHTTTDTSINLMNNVDNSSRNQRNLESDIDTNRKDSSYKDYFSCDEESPLDLTDNEPEEENTITDTDISNEESTENSLNSLNQSSSTSEEEYSDISVLTNDSSVESGSDMSLLTDASSSEIMSLNIRLNESTDSGIDMELNITLNESTDSETEMELNITLNESTDSEMDMEWDITSSAVGFPTDVSPRSSPFFQNIMSRLTSPRLQNTASAEDERTRKLREQAYRERRWSLEECSICFDVMLGDQQLMQLPCTHNFHVACIGPWLQEHQTCPMCRKPAE